MKIAAHVAVAGHPDLTIRTRIDKLALELTGEAALELVTERLHGTVGEIPVRVAIPFMPPHRGRVLAASVGPVEVTVQPIEARVKAFGVRLGAAVGPEGIAAETHVLGRCKLDMDLHGDIPGRMLKAAMEGVFEE